MAKRDATGAELDGVVALAETLPLGVFADMLIDMRLLFPGAIAVNSATLARIRAAARIPTFFRRLTLNCFPKTTKLPFDAQHLLDKGYLGAIRADAENRAWRLHLGRMVQLLRRLRIRYVYESEAFTMTVHNEHSPQTCATLTSLKKVRVIQKTNAKLFVVFGEHDRSMIIRAGGWLRYSPVQGRTAVLFDDHQMRYTVDGLIVDIEPSLMTDADMTVFVLTTAAFVQPLPVFQRTRQLTVHVEAMLSFSVVRATYSVNTTLGIIIDTLNEPLDKIRWGSIAFMYGDKHVFILELLTEQNSLRELTLLQVLPPDVNTVRLN